MKLPIKPKRPTAIARRGVEGAVSTPTKVTPPRAAPRKKPVWSPADIIHTARRAEDKTGSPAPKTSRTPGAQATPAPQSKSTKRSGDVAKSRLALPVADTGPEGENKPQQVMATGDAGSQASRADPDVAAPSDGVDTSSPVNGATLDMAHPCDAPPSEGVAQHPVAKTIPSDCSKPSSRRCSLDEWGKVASAVTSGAATSGAARSSDPTARSLATGAVTARIMLTAPVRPAAASSEASHRQMTAGRKHGADVENAGRSAAQQASRVATHPAGAQEVSGFDIIEMPKRSVRTMEDDPFGGTF